MARYTQIIFFCIFASLLLFPVSSFAVKRESAPSLNSPFRVKWVTKLKKDRVVTRRPFQLSSPVVSDGVVYVGSSSGHFYALSAKNGAKLWKTKLSSEIYAEALVDGEILFIADRKGIVYALAKSTGNIEWQVDIGEEISARPVFSDDGIYVVTALRKVVLLDKEGRGKKWQTSRTGALPKMTIKGSSSPVLFNGKVFVGFADGSLVCYNASNGDVVWEKQLSSKSSQFIDIDATPLIANGVLYIPTEDGKTFAIDPVSGKNIWVADKGGSNDLLYDNDKIYVSGNGVLSLVDPSNGKIIWEQKFNDPEISSPVIRDGLLFVSSTKDKLYVVDASTGVIKFKRFLGKGSFGRPVISGDVIYLLTNSSTMVALTKR